MIELFKYTNNDKSQWDQLISTSRNGSFMFFRDYLDYHSERFKDHSFVIFKKGKIEAVIPGNIKGSTYCSHEGLTYGGIVSTSKICTSDMLEIFNLLNIELSRLGVKEVIYKSIPSIYHKMPCQEDIYALSRNNAIKIGCNISTTISMSNKLPFQELRKRGIKKSQKKGITVCESDDYYNFWEILKKNLAQKYNNKPTHTLNEITYLKNRFPENIKLYVACETNEIVAGAIVFITANVVHVQYISANEQGKELGAMDMIFDELINREFISKQFFDFGISTENMGVYLNENLIFQKEGFGGRGIVYEIYKYNLNETKVLIS